MAPATSVLGGAKSVNQALYHVDFIEDFHPKIEIFGKRSQRLQQITLCVVFAW